MVFKDLPIIQRVFNTQEKSSTGVSPADLVLTNLYSQTNMQTNLYSPTNSAKAIETGITVRDGYYVTIFDPEGALPRLAKNKYLEMHDAFPYSKFFLSPKTLDKSRVLVSKSLTYSHGQRRGTVPYS